MNRMLDYRYRNWRLFVSTDVSDQRCSELRAMSERAAELAILKKLSLHGDGLSAEEKREREELRVLEKQIASAWIKRELISEAEFASQCGASVEFACL